MIHSLIVLAFLAGQPAASPPVHPVNAEPAATIEIQHAWARPTPKLAKSGAVYLTIVNHAGDDRVTAVTTPAAGSASMHLSQETGGVMQMRPLPSLDIKAGATVAFEPMAMHIMLTDLTAPLEAGQSFPLTLHFEKAGDVTVQVTVELNGDSSGAMPGMKM